MRPQPLLMPSATGMTFKNRLFLLLLLVIGLQLLVIGIYVHHRIADIIDREIGNRALVQARQIATNPMIIQSMLQHDYDKIRTYIDTLQHSYSDASYIVIGDPKEIRITHPNHDQIGFHMIGGDNSPALLRKQSFISTGRGSYGFAIRGKAPILDDKG